MTSKSSIKLTPSPWDALVAAVIIIAGVALAAGLVRGQMGGESGRLTAVISQNGQVMETVDLTAMEEPRREIMIKGDYTAVITLERTRVCVFSSDCPTQDCVHTGWITRAGQSVVCLPNRLVVELTGGSGESVDAVLG